MYNVLFFCSVRCVYEIAINAQANNQTANRAVVSGTVTDSSGAAIGAAEVRLVNARQLVLGATKSDTQGRYQFENV